MEYEEKKKKTRKALRTFSESVVHENLYTAYKYVSAAELTLATSWETSCTVRILRIRWMNGVCVKHPTFGIASFFSPHTTKERKTRYLGFIIIFFFVIQGHSPKSSSLTNPKTTAKNKIIISLLFFLQFRAEAARYTKIRS